MASFCLLIFELKKKLGKRVSMGDLVHVSGAAFQPNDCSEKDGSHKLEMYPVWPNWGLLLSDCDFVSRRNYNKLVQRRHSICVSGENLPTLREEGKIELENFCWYSHPEDSKAFPILLNSLHNNSVPREHLHFQFWTSLKDNNKRLKPNVSLHRRIGIL